MNDTAGMHICYVARFVLLSSRALHVVICDVLGLTAGEREAVYEAVVALVRARLEKAKSV